MFRFCHVFPAVFMCYACVAVGQQSTPTSPHVTVARGPLTTSAQKLKEHNIPLNKSALVAALRDTDPEVRSLAAAELAEERAMDTVLSIEEALDREDVPTAKINIAAALAHLGEQRGTEILKEACSESGNPEPMKMLATRYLLDFGNPYCIAAEYEALRNESDQDSRIQALGLVSKFGGISPADKTELVNLSVQALNDPSAGVRISAGDALAKLGDSSATPYLQRAAADERDKEVRSQLDLDLRQLQRQQAK